MFLYRRPSNGNLANKNSKIEPLCREPLQTKVGNKRYDNNVEIVLHLLSTRYRNRPRKQINHNFAPILYLLLADILMRSPYLRGMT